MSRVRTMRRLVEAECGGAELRGAEQASALTMLREMAEQERRRKKFADIEAWIVARFDVTRLRPTFRDLLVSARRWDDDEVRVGLDWDESTPAQVRTPAPVLFEDFDPHTAYFELEPVRLPVVRDPKRVVRRISMSELARAGYEGDEYAPFRRLFWDLGHALDKHRGTPGHERLFGLAEDTIDPSSAAYIEKLEGRFRATSASPDRP